MNRTRTQIMQYAYKIFVCTSKKFKALHSVKTWKNAIQLAKIASQEWLDFTLTCNATKPANTYKKRIEKGIKLVNKKSYRQILAKRAYEMLKKNNFLPLFSLCYNLAKMQLQRGYIPATEITMF